MRKFERGFGPFKLSQRHELWVYSLGMLLLVSGLGWLIAHYFLASAGDFGESHHASEPWWLRLHGAGAMGFLVVFGAVLPVHVVRAWHLKKNRHSGGFMIAVVLILVITAYGLYYAGDDKFRVWLSAVHWITGFLAAAGLTVHVWLGRRVHRYNHALHRRSKGDPHHPIKAEH